MHHGVVNPFQRVLGNKNGNASFTLGCGFVILSRRTVRVLVATVCFVALGPLHFDGAAFGQSCNADINGDGEIDGVDLAAILSSWGSCPAVISSVAPAQGSVLGGTVITLTGTGLATTTAVKVGGNPCTALQVISATEVRATTPPGSAGSAPIEVTTSAGTFVAATQFTYVMQSVQSIVPSSGYALGGTSITITGDRLAGTTSVTIGGMPATNLVVVNSTTVTAVTPPGSVGTVDVVVTGPKGDLTIAGGFQYIQPWFTVLEALPDPAVVTNSAARKAIAASGLPWRVRDNGTQIEMVLVPAATFDMGCSPSNSVSCEDDEFPVHGVTLSRSFYMARCEVTQAQWQAVMGSNPSVYSGASYPDAASRPVENVSWNMVAGSNGFLAVTGLRLPTEAEWEHACRGGTTTAFHSAPSAPMGTNDDSTVGSVAWFSGNIGTWGTASWGTHPVGLKAANALGLFDMHGNVWEWVHDRYNAGYYQWSPAIDPTGPATGNFGRGIRGGSWIDESGQLRSSNRNNLALDSQSEVVGFRVARNP